MIIKLILAIVMLCSAYTIADINHESIETGSTQRPDSHAPIGVMADHGHRLKEVMLSTRYMSMPMRTLFSGSSEINSSEVSGYSMVPDAMYMSMIMIGGMVGLNDKFTVMSMIGLADKSMTATGMMSKSMNTSGITDMKLSGLYTFMKTAQHVALAQVGLSLPIGSIDEKDSGTTRLAYPMQLGSGTYDIQLSTTYTQFKKSFSFGGQLQTIVRTGKNSNGYRLGNQFSVTAWLSKVIHETVSVSIRLTRQSRSDIEGADSTLMTTMSPANSTNTGLVNYSVATGANIQLPKQWSGSRVAVEYVVPVYQDVNNVQLGLDNTLTVGVQHLF